MSIVTLLIPLLLFLISSHLETYVTKSSLHDVILNRCSYPLNPLPSLFFVCLRLVLSADISFGFAG